LHYCKNCKSEQEMVYSGPLVQKKNLDKLRDPDEFKDLHLYVCLRCKSSLMFREHGDNPKR